MASPEPANIRTDRITARFNPPVISVNGFDLRDEILADIPLPDLVEKPFDIFTQFTLITLQVNQIIGFFFFDFFCKFRVGTPSHQWSRLRLLYSAVPAIPGSP